MNLLHKMLLEGKLVSTHSEQEKREFFSACDNLGITWSQCERAIGLHSKGNDYCFLLWGENLKWGTQRDIESLSMYHDKIVPWRDIFAIMSGQPIFQY